MQRAILLAGLGFGDEGKGTMVDYLSRTYNAAVVVRYNGGSQAAHNVVTKDGRHHTFAQFGSGSFVLGVKTFLSRYMVTNPLSMMPEAEHLESLGLGDIWRRLYVDSRALVTTPYHQAANRLRETARGAQRHGSCGLGVGETILDFQRGEESVFVADLQTLGLLTDKLQHIRQRKIESLQNELELSQRDKHILLSDEVFGKIVSLYREVAKKIQIVDSSYLSDALSLGIVIFEGAQGLLLDQKFGFSPFVTKTNTTFANGENLLEEAGFTGEFKKIGVLRVYATRHGAGPLPTEDKLMLKYLPEPHNVFNPWQSDFRVGDFDAVLAEYALKSIGGVDELALTCLDKISALPELKARIGQQPNGPVYKFLGGAQELVSFLQNYLQIPINTLSFGPTAEDKQQLTALKCTI